MSSPARVVLLIILGLAACGGGTAKTPDAPPLPDASVCPSSQTDCNGTCATLSSDPSNCGACGSACAAGNVCSNGTCQLSCQAGLSDCSGTCANLMTDNANCGGCGNTCAAGQVCSNGTCQLSCQASLTDCNDTCVNLLSDDANCGACGTACDPGSVCSNGTCQLSCQSGLADCNGTCANLNSDNANCGTCGTVCGPTETCAMGTCVSSCSAPLTTCGGVCTDLSDDPANCGACGTTCGPSQACKAGTCQDLVLYLPSGPQQNVPVAALSGWSLCYSDTYDQNLNAQLSTIQANCTGSRIMMACRPHDSSTITLLAQGLRTDVFMDTGATNNQGHSDGQVRWYYDGNFSWGFASPGETLNLDECDYEDTGADRLCWHTLSYGVGGYRCGDTTELNGSTAWDRLIYQAN